MDDKKINLLPEDLRSREDRSKRPSLNFNPDFKLPGQKQKSLSYKQSGGDVSWWSKIFKSEKKPKVVPASPVAPRNSISYNDDSAKVNPPKVTPIEMRVPEKIEEHIQDFAPAESTTAKTKTPSFWSGFARQPKPKVQATQASALSNGLKYNGNGNGNMAMNQPVAKADIKVFQELNKQAEETNSFNLKDKKISDQVIAVPKVEPLLEKKERSIPSYAIQETKPVKVKGQSWWSKFLALFKSKPKENKIQASVLNGDLKQNINATIQNKVEPAMKPIEIKNDLKVAPEPIKPVEQANNFDLTNKINEEIGLSPLQPITPTPQPSVPELKPEMNGFSMPEYAPKVESPVTPLAKEISVDKPAPRVTGPQFHIPEASQKNSLLNGRVDLIPIAARVRSWKQIASLLSFAIFLSLLIIGGLYGYLIYDEQRIISQQNTHKEEIAKIEAKILDFTELNKNISALGQEIKLVQDTLNKHIYWTNFFKLLEKYTVSDVYYSGLAVGTNGGLTLNASTKSYDSVAKQLKVLNSDAAKEFVKSASITSAKQDKDQNVSFQIILSLNQSLFYYRQAQ